MKKLFSFLVILCFLQQLQGQCPVGPPQLLGAYYEYKWTKFRDLLQIPRHSLPLGCVDTAMLYYNPVDSNIYGWTGSQYLCLSCGRGTLQSVTTAGNTTDQQVKIYKDTTFTFHLKTQGATFGDSVLSLADSIVSFGDSWTFGTGVSPTTLGYAYLLAGYYSCTLFNRGVNGWTLVSQGLGTSLMENLNLIPVKTGNMKLLTFMFGLNDSHYGLSTTTFIADYGTVIDTAVARGWPLSKIVIFSPGYNNGVYSPTITNFVTAAQTAAANKGVQFVNTYAGMVGYGVNGLIGPDSLHPTVTGYFYVAQIGARGITGLSLAGNITANGTSTFNGPNIYNGNETHVGLALNPFNGSTGSGIGKYTMRLQIGRITNNNYTSPIRFSPNALDGSQTFPDSIDLQVYNNGGRPELGFARNVTNFLRFPFNGGANFDGAVAPNTTLKYAFNNGGIYVNGSTAIHGRDSIYGAVYATGDNVVSANKFLWYSSGSANIGVDVFANGNFNLFNFNSNFNLGYKPTATFVPLVSLHTITNNVTIGNDSTGTSIPSAVLISNSTTQGWLPPRMTTTQKDAIGSPPEGLQVYDLTLHQMSYWNGTAWINL